LTAAYCYALCEEHVRESERMMAAIILSLSRDPPPSWNGEEEEEEEERSAWRVLLLRMQIPESEWNLLN
jgi:hypothetical protein